MRRSRRFSPSTAVLVFGVALRVVFGIVTPPQWAYDNHFEPVRIIVEERRLPRADECWECYQPPLYYLIAAGPYTLFSQVAEAASASTRPEYAPKRWAEKAVQMLSVVFGCVTLVAARQTLRLVLGADGRREAAAMSVIAFLPQHVYMSAMATNDALTYLFAALAIHFAIRAHQRDPGADAIPGGIALEARAPRVRGGRMRPWVFVGVMSGMAVLSKGYGAVTGASIVATCGYFAWRVGRLGNERSATSDPVHSIGEGPTRAEWLRRAVVVLLLTSLVGAWPAIRNVRHYGRPHVDNFEFFRTAMLCQPPGSIDRTEFLSFHPVALWRYPWVHVTHVNSFWTELYGRLWFDYEPMHTLSAHSGWRKLQARASRLSPNWNERRWQHVLSYSDTDMPPGMRWIARASYVAGLPLTLLILAGFLRALRQGLREFSFLVIVIHLLAALAVPVVQTLRLPHFSAMKAAFALSALSSVPIMAALATSGRRDRISAGLVSASLLVGVLVGLLNAAYAWELLRLFAGMG